MEGISGYEMDLVSYEGMRFETYTSRISSNGVMASCVNAPFSKLKLALHVGLEPVQVLVLRLGDQAVRIVICRDGCSVRIDVAP